MCGWERTECNIHIYFPVVSLIPGETAGAEPQAQTHICKCVPSFRTDHHKVIKTTVSGRKGDGTEPKKPKASLALSNTYVKMTSF